MSKYHSTISRRDFLKMLGLGGVGLGAAAISAPVFRDLDEMMASPQAEFKRPSWVKEVDKPTVEIDWNMYGRWDYNESMWQNGFYKAWGTTKADFLFKLSSANTMKFVKENTPGYTLRDCAMQNSSSVPMSVSFLGPQTSPTPESLGVPRWEGTPEENARMIRAYLRTIGSAQVGFVELDTDTTEKLFYSYDGDPWSMPVQGKKITFADVDQPSETETEKIVPKKARLVIIYTNRMPEWNVKRAPTSVGYMNVGYTQGHVMQYQLQNFLRTLGYMGLGESGHFHEFGCVTGLGVMAGLGETCRAMHLLTPEYGLKQRFFKLVTDLPLAPGKPIDFGAMQFCRTCKKCAEFCPPKAIPSDTEPSWENTVPYHTAGQRIWRRNEPACIAYMYESVGWCSVCIAVCPLSKGNRQAFYHDIMRSTISTTPVFNRFFRKMDDFLGYGMKRDSEDFWEMDLPPFGWE